MEILTHAKHITGDVDGVRCSVVENGITVERAQFLKDILQSNGLEVKMQQDAPTEGAAEALYTIGVTDITFNIVYAIYERRLKKPDGKVVSPAFWRQEKGDTSGWYWNYGQKEIADYYE